MNKATCAYCGYPAHELLEDVMPGLGERRKALLCEICRLSPIRGAILSGSEAEVLRTVAYVGNLILEELRRKPKQIL